jgi:hypothetical protein
MICKLCEEPFNLDLNFSSLFSFPEICPECEIKFRPALKREVIPINNGEVTYLYLYDLNLSYKQRQYLDRRLKIIYKYLMKHEEEFDIIILLDDYTIKKVVNSWRLIEPFKSICFFSLKYYDLSYYNFFE